MTNNFYCYKVLLIIIINLFAYNNNYAQSFENCGDFEGDSINCVVRLRSGGTVDFRVNSLTKYRDGIEYDLWTRLTIHFEDDDPDANTGKLWSLKFKVHTDKIIGDEGRDLDLDIISLKIDVYPVNSDFSGTNLTDNETITLNDGREGYTELITGGNQGVFDIYITYLLEGLLGEYPGYYVTDILFELSAE